MPGQASTAEARDVKYTGSEQTVYVTPGEPTQITFPDEIKGGFKRKHSSLALQRQTNFLVVFAQPDTRCVPPAAPALAARAGGRPARLSCSAP